MNPLLYNAAPSFTPLFFCLYYGCGDDKKTETVGLRFLLWNSFCHAISCNTCPADNFSPWCMHTWDKIFHICHCPTSLHHFVLLLRFSPFLSSLCSLSLYPSRPAPLPPDVCSGGEGPRGGQLLAGRQTDKLVRWMGGHVQARRACRDTQGLVIHQEREMERQTQGSLEGRSSISVASSKRLVSFGMWQIFLPLYMEQGTTQNDTPTGNLTWLTHLSTGHPSDTVKVECGRGAPTGETVAVALVQSDGLLRSRPVQHYTLQLFQ